MHTKKTIIFLTAVILMLSLSACGKSKIDTQFDVKSYLDAPSNTLLVDYCDRTVGTPIEMPYDEIVLYTYSDTQCLLEVYDEGGSEDETVTRYLIPLDEAQRILDAVRDSGMNDWSRRSDLTAICGKSYVCRFPDGSGGITRVSSDNMPPDGSGAFGRVEAAMRSCCKDAYRQ